MPYPMITRDCLVSSQDLLRKFLSEAKKEGNLKQITHYEQAIKNSEERLKEWDAKTA